MNGENSVNRDGFLETFAADVIGFLATAHGGAGYLLGVVHINTLDNFLQLGLGAVIGAAGWYFHARPASVQGSLAIQQR